MNNRRCTWKTFPVVLLLMFCMPGGAASAAELKKITSVEGITEYALDNGLKVLLFPDPSKPTITVNITYLVGSRHEAYGETGMAHLLEHLVFKGTPKHPNIPQELTERGASPNGTTSFDRTNYFETFPASEDNLAWALDLEADRMVNSFISAEDLASEMTVVRNEMENGENNPFRILYQRTMATAYLWHNYGNSTIGARADVENVPIERLQAFYRKYYQPDNAVLVVAGKFDVDKAKSLIIDKFGAIDRPDRSGANRIYPTYTRDPAQDGERMITLRRVGDVQMVMAVFHIPPGSHEDLAALDLLSHALSNAPSGRLHKALVEPGFAASVSSAAYQYREAGPLFLYAQVRQQDSLDETWEIMAKTVYGTVADRPITEEEVERARSTYSNYFEQVFNSSQSVALQLSNWAAMGDWRLFFLHRDRLDQATTEDVNRVAADYLKPQNSTVGFFRPTETPDRAEIPEVPDMEVMLADYQGRKALKVGEIFDPSPENIEHRTTTVTFDNGFQLALLPKSTRGETVVVSVTLRHGTEVALANRAVSAGMTGGMLMRGTERLSRQELTDELNRLRAQGGISGGVATVGGSLQTTRQNLLSLLRLAGEVLKQPAFDANQFQELKRQQLAGYEQSRSDPRSLAVRAFNRLLNPLPKGHPRYVPTFDEAIAATEGVTLQELQDFHDLFYGAAHGQMAIVGDFDPEEVEPVVGEMFGNWSAEAPYARLPNAHFEVPAERVVVQTPDKANAYFSAGLNLPIRDDHEDYPALVLANFMLGGGFLNSRLATRIRQQDGLSYSVGSSFYADSFDAAGLFTGRAIYAPENGEALETAFFDELAKARKSGFTDEEVADAKNGLIERARNARANDRTLAALLTNNLYTGRTMAWTHEFEERIQALKPKQIRAALRRHIDPDDVSVVVAGDF